MMRRPHRILASFASLAFFASGCGTLIGLDGYSLATCRDGVQGGDETGVDCGGSCAPCAADAACADGVRDNGETDVDCGGPCGVKCEVGQGCVVGPDCLSRICSTGTCGPPACDDNVLNGEETGLDCGGPCPSACEDGEGCAAAKDCQSLVCEASACAPTHALSRSFEATPGYTQVAVDGAGNIFLAGTFSGALDVGGGPLSMTTDGRIFLAKFDPEGTHLWSKSFGGGQTQVSTALAADSAGNAVLTGYFNESVDFGGGALMSAGSADIFVAKFAANGDHLWSERFGDAGRQVANAVALDPGGGVILTGELEGSADFGGGPRQSAGKQDVFVARLSPDGAHVFSARFGDVSYDQAGHGVAVDTDGRVTVTGTFSGELDFGDGSPMSTGNNDGFVLHLGAAGEILWTKQIGDTFDEEYAFFVAADGEGGLLVGGLFENLIELGTGELLKSAGGTDFFLLKLAESGAPVWAKAFGTELFDGFFPFSGSLDKGGAVTVAGSFEGTMDLGAGPISSPGYGSVFIARLDPAGKHVWSRHFGGAPESSYFTALAPLPPGATVLTGSFKGSLDFGGGPLQAGEDRAIFFAKLRVP